MYDKEKILPGILVFLCVITFPVWYNAANGKASSLPEPKIPPGTKSCVESKEYMRQFHMTLLDHWRDEVVRKGNTVYVNRDGKKFDMSLSNTCMNCHSNKSQFCDQCHNYMKVDPYCWDCHIEPMENS